MATDVQEVVVSLELVEVAPASPARRAAAEEGDALPTRPSVRLGRQLSVKKKRQVGRTTTAADGEGGEEQSQHTPFQREAARYRSLQLRPRRSESPVRVRRASSLTGVNRYEEWEELTVNFGNLRQSSRRLEERIALQ
jgi:hypothetical protein